MNRYKVLIVGLLVLSALVLLMTLRPVKAVAPKSDSAVAAGEKKPGASGKTAAITERTKNPSRTKTSPGASPKRAVAEVDAENAAAAPNEDGSSATSEPKTPREKAVEAWETLVDQLAEQKDASPQEQAARVKEAFDKLDKEDQMDGIHRSLNLLPDEQFPALYAILYDKTEDAEVLDAIFSDALNRPEELKNPLMKELVKDKEHPCFFESARILDVIGELDTKPAPTASP